MIITELEKLDIRSDEVDVRKDNVEIRKIVNELKEAIKENNLISLSAVQLGYPKRIFCLRFKKDIRTFVNPIITNARGLALSREICPSLPGKIYLRPRNTNINFMFQTPLGKTESASLAGLGAYMFQHEMDHLDGLLLSDIGLEIDEDFLNASEKERQEVIDAYLESLDLKRKEIHTEIQEDPELKQMSDAIDFIGSVAKGEVKLGQGVEITTPSKSNKGE